MLNTNTVSHLIKGHSVMASRVVAVPMVALCISAITEGELLLGLAKHPDAKRLHVIVQEFLRWVDVLPWDSSVTTYYGTMRTEMEQRGKTLAPLNLLIATHALSVGAVLVTNDQAFYQMAGLSVDDWTV